MYSNHKSPRRVSRRVVLGTAAGAGAVGAAAAVGINKFVDDDKGSQSTASAAVTAEQGTSAAETTSANMTENSLVAWMPDPNGKKVLFFRGFDSYEVEDQELIAQMNRVAKQ